MLSADFNRLINKEVHFEGDPQLAANVTTNFGFLYCTHLDNGMEEGQHIDERTIGRVGAGLETILTYFNISGAYIQLQPIGRLRDHCGGIKDKYSKIYIEYSSTHPSATFAICQWEMLVSDLW